MNFFRYIPEEVIQSQVEDAKNDILEGFDIGEDSIKELDKRINKYLNDKLDVNSILKSGNKFDFFATLYFKKNEIKTIEKLIKISEQELSESYYTVRKIRCNRYDFIDKEYVKESLTNPFAIRILPFKVKLSEEIDKENINIELLTILDIVFREDIIYTLERLIIYSIHDYAFKLYYNNWFFNLRNYIVSPFRNSISLWASFLATMILSVFVSFNKPIINIKSDSAQSVSLGLLGALSSILGFLVVFLQLSFDNIKKIYGTFVKEYYINRNWFDIISVLSLALIFSFLSSIVKDESAIAQQVIFNLSIVSCIILVISIYYRIPKIIDYSMSTSEIDNIINNIDIKTINNYGNTAYTYKYDYDTMPDETSLTLSKIVSHNVNQGDFTIINTVTHSLLNRMKQLQEEFSYKRNDSVTSSERDSYHMECLLNYSTKIVYNIFLEIGSSRNNIATNKLLSFLLNLNNDIAYMEFGIVRANPVLRYLEDISSEALLKGQYDILSESMDVYFKCLLSHIRINNIKKEVDIEDDMLGNTSDNARLLYKEIAHSYYTLAYESSRNINDKKIASKIVINYCRIIDAFCQYKHNFTEMQLYTILKYQQTAAVNFYLSVEHNFSSYEFPQEPVDYSSIEATLYYSSKYYLIPFNNYLYYYTRKITERKIRTYESFYLMEAMLSNMFLKNNVGYEICLIEVLKFMKLGLQYCFEEDYPSRHSLFRSLNFSYTNIMKNFNSNNNRIRIGSDLFSILKVIDQYQRKLEPIIG